MAQYLAEGDQLRDAVNAYRAARGEASAESPPPKPQRIATQQYPSVIPGFPLNPNPPKKAPDYGSMARVAATRAAMAERRGKRAPMKPNGPFRLVKRRDGEERQ
jgi:hypothetical protein